MSPAEAESISSRSVGVHPHDAAEAFLVAVALVEVATPLDEAALVDPHEGQRAVGVLDDLEGHGHGRFVRVGRQQHLLDGVAVHQGLDLAIQRRGQVADHGVQKRLHPLVAIGAAQEHRRQLLIEDRQPDRLVDQLARHRLLGQQQLHDGVAIHRQRFQQVLPGPPGLVRQLGRDRLAADVLAVGAVEIDGLLGKQVDHPLEIGLAADGDLHGHRVAAKLGPQLLDHFAGVGPTRSILLTKASRGT